MRSIGNFHLFTYDEAQFQTAPVFGASTPWLTQSIAVMWFVSTAAVKETSPALEMLRRTWSDNPNERVIRALVLDATGQLVVEPVVSTLTATEYYKERLKEMIADGHQLRPGESLMDGSIILPWWKSDIGSEELAVYQAKLAQESKKLEDYLIEARLPPHQDPYSAKVLKNVMGAESYELEMQSKTEARDAKTAARTVAFDRYSVQLLAERTRRRVEHSDALLRSYTMTSNASSIRDHFFGQYTTEFGKPPIIYVYYDPANGGANSDAIIISCIYRAHIPDSTLDTLRSMQKRDLRVIKQMHKYLESVDTLVRCILSYITFGQKFVMMSSNRVGKGVQQSFR